MQSLCPGNGAADWYRILPFSNAPGTTAGERCIDGVRYLDCSATRETSLDELDDGQGVDGGSCRSRCINLSLVKAFVRDGSATAVAAMLDDRQEAPVGNGTS